MTCNRVAKIARLAHPRDVSTLTASQLRRLEQAFDQQMWCWGRDSTRPEGNLLLEFGFTRQPPPSGSKLSSTYQLVLADGARLSLNSAGLHFDDPCGNHLCLLRGPIEPQLARLPTDSLRGLLRWLAAYERWVSCRSHSWRSQTLAARSRRPRFTAEALPALFEELAGALST